MLLAGSTSALGASLLAGLRSRSSSRPVTVLALARGEQPNLAADGAADVGAAARNFPNFTVKPLTWDGVTPPPLESVPELSNLTHVINLCGDSIAEGALGPIRPWEQPGKLESVVSSRTESTRGLLSWLERNAGGLSAAKIHHINAGGVGIYGGDHTLASSPPPEATSEAHPAPGKRESGFLAEVSREWEAAATTSNPGKIQVSVLRIAPVLLAAPGVFSAPGVLKSLLPAFFFGAGGRVGSGTQMFPFVGERDFQAAVLDHVMQAGEGGVYNIVSPSRISNEQFSRSLANALGRPCLLPMPAFVVRQLFGRMGEEVLLGGVTATPKRLLDEGYDFLDADVDSAMKHAVGGVKLMG